MEQAPDLLYLTVARMLLETKLGRMRGCLCRKKHFSYSNFTHEVMVYHFHENPVPWKLIREDINFMMLSMAKVVRAKKKLLDF